ncbi:MAG TPA: flagellar hook capping FlgD N-terminal domain-containing protein, partial [Gammaproteobacteria bacterium]|nr:flagellar hook capping FlgD N-terminal domain-containing protein [Gammaproteobacteria bacterium]
MNSILGSATSGSTQTSGTGGLSQYDPSQQRQIFLKMLVTQMENQNPLDPMKNKEMMSQMAQFSGVEQQIKSNDLLSQLVNQKQQGHSMQAVGLLGKQVWVKGEPALSTTDGQSHAFRFDLKDGGPMQAKVTNSAGQVVRTMDLGARGAGVSQATWDGKTDSGLAAPTGTYQIQVSRTDVQDAKPQSVQIRSTVQEVRYPDSGTQVGINGGRFVAFDKVAAVTN